MLNTQFSMVVYPIQAFIMISTEQQIRLLLVQEEQMLVS